MDPNDPILRGPERAIHAAERIRRRVHLHDRRGNAFLGVVIVALGVMFLLSNLDLIDFRLTFRMFWRFFWPVTLFAWGVHTLINSRGTGRLFGIGLAAFGILLFTDQLIGWRVEWWNLFWPTMLILFGVHVFFNSQRAHTQGWQDPQADPLVTPPPIPPSSRPGETSGDAGTDGTGAPNRPGGGRVDPSSTFKETAFLAGIERRNISQTFRGGEASAFLGGVELDLRECRMAADAAHVDLFAMLGSVELRIPRDWTVESRVTALLAGVEDHSEPPVTPDAKRLVIRGSVLLGSIEIRN